jgi:hypothetical protein
MGVRFSQGAVEQKRRLSSRTLPGALLFLSIAGWCVSPATSGENLPSSAVSAAQAAVSSFRGSLDPVYRLTQRDGTVRGSLRGGVTADLRAGAVALKVSRHAWTLSPAAIGRRGHMERPTLGRAQGAGNHVDYHGPALNAWFVNGPEGLEQGWTLEKAPAGRGELQLRLAVGGDLEPVIAADGRSAAFQTKSGTVVLRYAGLTVTDSRRGDLPASFRHQGSSLILAVNDRNARYPLQIDPFIQVAEITSPRPLADQSFGNTAAMSADGSTLAVGASGTTVNGHADQGALFVFARGADGWQTSTKVAELTVAGGASGDGLGFFPGSVAISADGSTIVAGSPDVKVGDNIQEGSAYVFLRPGATWSDTTQAATLLPATGEAGELISPVAVSADGATIAVGAGGATVATQAGAGEILVFTRPAQGWQTVPPTATLSPPSPGAHGGLGLEAVSISADARTIAAGAPVEAVNFHAGQGAVYVYQRSGAAWSSTSDAVRLISPTGGPQDELGISLVLSSDGSTIAAASRAKVGVNALQGALTIFVRPEGGWDVVNPAAQLTQSDGRPSESFGISGLAINANGSTVLGGAYLHEVSGMAQAGATYLYTRPSSGWISATETEELTAADAAPGDQFGFPTMDGAGSVFAIGARYRVVNFVGFAGTVYFFDRPGCVSDATTVCLDDQAGDGRWQVRATYSTAQDGGKVGDGQAIGLVPEDVSRGGLFWFFDPSNPEMLVKVLNGCGVNNSFWVFSSATTNVGFQMTVTDTKTGRTKSYGNTDGAAAVPIQDTAAFACSGGDIRKSAASALGSARREPDSPVRPSGTSLHSPRLSSDSGCSSSSSSLCIDDRFVVTANFHTAEGAGSSGSGQAIALGDVGVTQGGLLWFFDPTNPEMLVKVINACSFNNKYWIFYAAGTNVGFSLTVTDTVSGQSKTYQNADGTAAPPVQDTSALPCP